MKRTKKAFTLVELVVVIAILALLIAIAVPKYMASRKTAGITAHNANVRVLKTATMNYLIDNPEVTTVTAAELVSGGYIEKEPKVPKEVDGNHTSYTIGISGRNVTITPGEADVKGNP